MSLVYFLQGLLGLSIFVFLAFNLLSKRHKKHPKISKNFLMLGSLYFILSVLSIFWFFDVLRYSVKDYFVFYSILLVVQNFVFFRLTYIFSRNKKLYYFMGMYLFIIPFLVFIFHISSIMFLILSYLFSMLMFIDFVLRDDAYKKVGYLGIFYSAFSILIMSFLFFDSSNIFLFSLISNVILFILVRHFIYDILNFSVLPFRASEKNSYFFNLMSHLIFIITIANFVFIGTIGIHEFGHYFVSQFFNCEYSKIIYDASYFFTESLCATESVIPYITMGGIILPILISIVLFIFGGRFVSEIAILILGFNFTSLSKDLVSFGVGQNFVFISVLVGILLVVYGIFLLAKSKIDLEVYEDFSIKDFISEEKKKKIKESLAEGGKKE